MDPITSWLQSLIPGANVTAVTDPNSVTAAGVNGLLAAGDATGTVITNATNAATGGASSLWSNVQPWLIGAAILLGLLLVGNILSDVKEL